MDNIKEAIIICNEKGEIIRFNESARRLHSLPEKPISPARWAEYYDPYYPDGKTPLATKDIPLFRALQGEDVNNQEIIVIPQKGTPRVLSCSGQQIKDENGKKSGAVIAMHDITEFTQAEDNLQEALVQKDFFMKELKHRFKNNLNMVSALISLKNSESDEDLTGLKHRIDVIKLVHEKLNQHAEVDKIDLKEYLEQILKSVFSFSPKLVV